MRTISVFRPFAVLIVLIAFLMIGSFAIASAENGGPNAGLPDHLMLSWTDDPQTTQTISWRTGTDSSQDTVQYMPAAVFNGGFDGAEEVTGVASGLYDGHLHFEATLRGLTPNTSYVYRVGRDGAWSEPAGFTAGAGEDGFTFLYMGDVQDGYAFWGEMLDKAFRDNPSIRFGLLGGDLVDHGTSIAEWQQFFAAASPVFSRIPLMPAVGNHDDSELFRKSFAVPRNGPAGYEDTIYSFDYGNCHFTVLNSNFMGPLDLGDNERIAVWLQNDLENSEQQWKFVVFHHPPYPVVRDWRAEILQEYWVPILERCGVDMVFVGHQHVYMRAKPIRDGTIQPDGEGIVYIMGNAGMKYYAPGPGYDYIAEELAWVSNYQVIDINGNSLTMTAKDDNGQVIDSYQFVKQPIDEDFCYRVSPLADDAYTIGETADGISTMTVNGDVSGMTYFGVQVTPVVPHDGLETLVFTHSRDGSQLGLSVTRADFDMVGTAQTGFDVQPGDVIKAFIVDELTNAVDRNPIILQ